MMRVLMFTCLIINSCASAGRLSEDIVRYGGFGDVHIYKNSGASGNIVLFISGDGGWNLGVVDMARELASTGALVAGIDITHYLKALAKVDGACNYPAAHLESLSGYLQQKYHFPKYRLPVLVGYSSGATLVYTTLAQAPDNTFLGGISLGFCPDLPLPKPLCKGSGDLSWSRKQAGPTTTYYFNPTKQLRAPWVALQGEIDRVCMPEKTQAFVKQLPLSRVIMLPKVGHGYSVPKNWLPQFRQVYLQMTSVSREANTAWPTDPKDKKVLDELPLIELPVKRSGDLMAIVISGDGGWAGIDKALGERLNADGIPVVGLNSLQYFWDRKTPEKTAADIDRIIRNYGKTWSRSKVILIGYSRGADVLPFVYNRLPSTSKALVNEVVALGLSRKIDFQFHVTDWIGGGNDREAMAVLPEIRKLSGVNMLCLYGTDEKNESLCPALDKSKFHVIEMPGGHHFRGDYKKIAEIVLENLSRK